MAAKSDIYLGNPNLKKANTQTEFTQEHIAEFLKCKDDPVYFTETHIKIVNVDEGLVNFNMYKFQKKLIKRIKENKNQLRIDEFISFALFEKNSYYIEKEPIGKKKDYITSPEISQMFGEIIGLYILNYWNNNINSEFNLIEFGPGNGTLLNDILRTTKLNTKFINLANILLIEINRN